MKHKKLIVLATLFSAGFMLATSQAVKADSVTGTIQVANNSSVRSNTNNTKQHKKDIQDAENTPVKDGWINQNGKRLELLMKIEVLRDCSQHFFNILLFVLFSFLSFEVRHYKIKR